MIDWLKKSALEPEIDLGGATLPIVLRRHPTAKRLTLRLAPDGSEVRITLPQCEFFCRHVNQCATVCITLPP